MIYKAENITDIGYTDALYQKAYYEMSRARQQKADRLKRELDKKLCVFSDMLLRTMLRESFGINHPEFCEDEKGKPYLLGNDLYFSLSHSGTYIACAIDTHPVGVDIETPRAVEPRVINHCCTAQESLYVCADPMTRTDPLPAQSEEAVRFLTLWTAKEAYLKFTGEGLTGGLKNIVTIENGKLKSTINDKHLTAIIQKDYVLSIISENT